MRAMMTALRAAENAQVLRVRLSRDGLGELSAAGGYDNRVSAELLDLDGEVCGRADRRPDPSAHRYGPGLCWHIQLGGVLASRVWDAQPMGCGSGETPYEACARAIDALRADAARRERAAAVLADIFSR